MCLKGNGEEKQKTPSVEERSHYLWAVTGDHPGGGAEGYTGTFEHHGRDYNVQEQAALHCCSVTLCR